MKMRDMDFKTALIEMKVRMVIASCKTINQVLVARNMVRNFEKMYGENPSLMRALELHSHKVTL